MQVIDNSLLDALSSAACKNPRLRQNHNFHQSFDEPCQRLLNAVEPGSYIRPHRHLEPPRPETFVVMRGRIAVVVFGEVGSIEQIVALAGDGAVRGVDIPAGVWHTVLSLESGTVFFEAKPGPYIPLTDKDWAPWGPDEGSPEAQAYLNRLIAAAKDDLR